jgi:hypothetical protein
MSALKYLDRTLFGQIAAFQRRRMAQEEVGVPKLPVKSQWSLLAGKSGYYSVEIHLNGAVETRRNGIMHSWNDEPALITAKGDRVWYYKGREHRNQDLPTAICYDGRKIWCQYGKLHRDGDLPAVIDLDGTQFWFKHGQKMKPP